MGGKQIGGPILEADQISLAFGGIQALNGVSLEIREHEILAIIGPNGAGKTSLLNVVNGFYHPQHGTLRWKGRVRRRMRPHEAAAQGIARTFQNVALFRGMTTLDNIMTGRLTRMRRNLFWQAIRKGPAEREELEHRAYVERIIDFLEIEAIRKVRRRIIAERYQPLLDALYSGHATGRIEIEITFEDGRKSHMRAELAIRDVGGSPAPDPPALRPAEPAEAVA